jgi:hypothetical protein
VLDTPLLMSPILSGLEPRELPKHAGSLPTEPLIKFLSFLQKLLMKIEFP